MSLTHNNNFKWYLVRDNFLSKDECEDIIKIIDDESKQIDTCGAQVVKLNEKIYLDNCSSCHKKNRSGINKKHYEKG